MNRITCLIILGILGLTGSVTIAQSSFTLPITDELRKPYDAGTRGMDGAPTENYWRNYARYTLTADLNPDTREVKCSGKMTYLNQSPDVLEQVVLRLHQNMYRPDSKRDDDLSEMELTEGVILDSLMLNGQPLVLEDNPNVQEDRTLLLIHLPTPLASGDSLTLSAEWSFTVPNGNTVRMGTYGTHSYFVGYWYPQFSVYDDVDGWDLTQYTGNLEFYQDFADFDIAITVPDSLLVWATGDLLNLDEVLTKPYADRYRKAMTSDEVISIVGPKEYEEQAVVAQPNGMNTWKFRSRDVPDVAFATSDYYYWDASSIEIEAENRRVFVDACYQPVSKDFLKVTAYTRDIIDFISTKVPGIPYPYSKMTVFNGDTRGYGGGMEYPMIVNDGSAFSEKTTFELTHHEIAHTYFPFMTGINEHRFAWMDEGWAEYLPTRLTGLRGYTERPMFEPAVGYRSMAGDKDEVPLMVHSKDWVGRSYVSNAYYKPAVAYHFLQQTMGDSLFMVALQTYIRRWEGKHPLPHDFFHTFDEVAGEKLDWFWRPWFFEDATPDLGLKAIKVKGKKASFVVLNKGGVPIPIRIRVIFDDKSQEEFTYTPAVWKDGKREILIERKFSGKRKIKEIRLGSTLIPDVNRRNNRIKAG